MHKHYNGLKTAALFGVLWAVLLGLGALIGTSMRSSTPIWIMALVGVATTAYGYWNSDKIALRSMQAYPVSELQAPQLYQMVRELSMRANQPMPRIFVSPTMAPNAFATGRNPRNAAVCCTEGILQLLSPRELPPEIRWRSPQRCTRSTRAFRRPRCRRTSGSSIPRI